MICGSCAASCRVLSAICSSSPSIRPRRSDPEIAGEGSASGSRRWPGASRARTLLRAFDLLTRAEADIRGASQPRYHSEMALLRWMHLRKLVPIEDLIAGLPAAGKARQRVPSPAAFQSGLRGRSRRVRLPRALRGTAAMPPTSVRLVRRIQGRAAAAEIRKARVLYNTVIAQVQKSRSRHPRVRSPFLPRRDAARLSSSKNRPWLETIASR
jgi:hypothetical protein